MCQGNYADLRNLNLENYKDKEVPIGISNRHIHPVSYTHLDVYKRQAHWSPFHGGMYAVLESVTRLVAMGGDYKTARLTLQEYFEKVKKDPIRWGKPLAALLGAFKAQRELSIPAIGGKDSMSGSFKEINVPPTLVSFAVGVIDDSLVLSPEFKGEGHKLVLLKSQCDANLAPDFAYQKQLYDTVARWNAQGKVLAAISLKAVSYTHLACCASLTSRAGVSAALLWKSWRIPVPPRVFPFGIPLKTVLTLSYISQRPAAPYKGLSTLLRS